MLSSMNDYPRKRKAKSIKKLQTLGGLAARLTRRPANAGRVDRTPFRSGCESWQPDAAPLFTMLAGSSRVDVQMPFRSVCDVKLASLNCIILDSFQVHRRWQDVDDDAA